MKIQSLRVYLYLSVLIFLLAFVLRITALHENSFWVDEAFTARVAVTAGNTDQFVEDIRLQLTHMPLYFASFLWYPGEHTDFSVRYLSMIWGLLMIAVTMRIISHFYGLRGYALLAGLILAIHLSTVTEARTARMYPMGNFFLASISYLFFRYINAPQDDKSSIYRLLFYILSMYAYLIHLSALILIPAQMLVWGWLVIKRRISFRPILYWLILQMLILIPAMLWRVFVFDTRINGLKWIADLSPKTIIATLNGLFIGRLDVSLFGYTDIPWHIIFVIPAIIGLWVGFRQIKHIQYWMGVTLFPFIGLVIISLSHPLLTTRYLSIAIFAYVVILVLGYKSLDDILTKRFKATGIILIRVLIGVYLIVISGLTLQRYQVDHFAPSYAKYPLEYVREFGKGGDRVISSYHYILVGHYIDRDKFWVLVYPKSFLRDYEINQTFATDRVWLVAEDRSSLKQFAEGNNFDPVYQYRNVSVYFIEADG